jgi:hypothetical protein
MKTKGLLMTNGIVGLIGGVLLVLGPFLITGGAVSDIANGTANTGGVSVLLNLLKIAALALGIIGLVYYKGDERVKPAANILLVVGGGVALIPFVDTHFIPTRFQAKAANNSRHGQPARRNYLPLFICTLIQQLRIQKEEPLPYTV